MTPTSPRTITASCFPGILCPVAFLANAWIVVEPAHRSLYCGALIAARNTIAYVYGVILFFSVSFRFILVVHSEKGLVKNGRLNLVLFRQLFWVAVCPFLAISHVISPLSSLLKGTFPSDSQAGRICLLESSQGSMKGSQIQAAFQLIMMCFTVYNNWRVKMFLSKKCPRNTLSCIGKFKRNVLSFKQTTVWVLFLCFSGLSSLLVFLLASFILESLSTEQMFWIWNIRSFLCFEGLHFVLPLFLKIPSNVEITRPFFITKSKRLEPRRPLHIQQGSQYISSKPHVLEPINENISYKCITYCKTHKNTTRTQV